MKKLILFFFCILSLSLISGIESGINNFNKGNWIYALFELKPEFFKQKQPTKKAWLAHYIATAYYNRGMHEQAIHWYKSSYNWYIIGKDLKNAQYELNNIGTIYLALKQYQTAKKYFISSTENSDPELIEWTKLNIGSVYYGLRQYDSAETIWRTVTDTSLQGTVAGNLAMLYTALNIKDSALKWYSVHIQSNNNDSYNIADSYLNMAKLAYKKLPKQSKIWLHKADSISDQLKDLELAISLADAKSIIHSDSFYYWHDIMYQLKDSLYQEQTESRLADQLQEFDLQHQMTQNSQKLALISAKKEWLDRALFISGGFLVLLICIIVIIIYQKRKIKKEKERTIILSNALKAKNGEINDSIKYTKALQDGILSSSDWIKNDPNMSLMYKPKDIVSGDFYWAKELNGIKYIAVCDSTGHGVPGAIMSSICYNAMNSIFNQSSLTKPLNELCTELNSAVWTTFTPQVRTKMKDGMDMSIVRISEDMIEWVGCNNQALYISSKQRLDQMHYQAESSKGHIYKISPTKYGIGSNEHATYDCKIIKRAKDDQILLFTDGVIDQFGGSENKKWKLKQLVVSIANSSDNITKSVNTDLTSWMGFHEQTDDITFLQIKL